MLRVWCFECQRCQRRVLLCTRCLGRRRYCEACAGTVLREQKGKAGRKYQLTPRGRRKHRLRSRRYRRCRRERLRACRLKPAAEGAGEAAGERSPPPPSAESAAPEPPSVTHRLVRPESSVSAKVESARTVAALKITGEAGAEESSNAEPRVGQAAVASVEDEGAATALARALSEAAAAAAHWPRAAGAQPMLVRCSCCGRVGELVVFESRLAVMRGPDPG